MRCAEKNSESVLIINFSELLPAGQGSTRIWVISFQEFIYSHFSHRVSNKIENEIQIFERPFRRNSFLLRTNPSLVLIRNRTVMTRKFALVSYDCQEGCPYVYF